MVTTLVRLCECRAGASPHHAHAQCPVVARWRTWPYVGAVGVVGVRWQDDPGTPPQTIALPYAAGEMWVSGCGHVPIAVLECLATWLQEEDL